MKVGILTFHPAINYGAVLQAYGLMKAIEKLGHDASIIDYRPPYLLWDRQPVNRPGVRSLKSIEGWKLWYQFLYGKSAKRKRIKKFDHFANGYLNLSPLEDFDAIVCGSDQIWNPNITGGALENLYWGIYPTNIKRTIAYAASAGALKNLKGFENQIKSKIQNFDSISCREAELTQYVNAVNEKTDAVTVLDPSILAGAEIFSTLASDKKINRPYLLYFDLFNDNSIRQRAKRIAAKRNLKFVEVSTYHEFSEDNKRLPIFSPEDFVSMIKYADFVVTTSFHGTAFSIVFNRPFLTFEYDESKNNRILNLLQLTNLDNRFIKRDASLPINDEFDWDSVNSQIEIEREKSLQFLRDALSD